MATIHRSHDQIYRIDCFEEMAIRKGSHVDGIDCICAACMAGSCSWDEPNCASVHSPMGSSHKASTGQDASWLCQYFMGPDSFLAASALSRVIRSLLAGSPGDDVGDQERRAAKAKI